MRPLQMETTASVCFAFGMAVKMDPSTRHHGLLAGLWDELAARGILRDLTARMDSDMQRNIATAVMLDRGAARSSTHRPRNTATTA